jgi:hypothetical protein
LFFSGAKAPTQRKRTTKIQKLEWDEKQDLGSVIPENYMQMIMYEKNPPQSFAHNAEAQFALIH